MAAYSRQRGQTDRLGTVLGLDWRYGPARVAREVVTGQAGSRTTLEPMGSLTFAGI